MIKRIPRLGVIGGVAVHVIATKACRGLSAFQSRHHQCSVFREALLNSAYLFFSFLPLTQSWSSPLQETSSMPWRHPALTSCWEGKAGTLLWAHSQSTQRRAPLFLESRPRGGDWSGLCFDTRFFFPSSSYHSDRFSSSPRRDRGGAELSQTVNVAFSVQKQNSTYAFCFVLLRRLLYQKTPRPSPLLSIFISDSRAGSVKHFKPPAALLRSPEPSAAVSLSKQYAFLLHT